MRLQRRSCWVALAVGLLLLLRAPSPAAASEPPTKVSVLTMGPGDHPFTRFGHNALLLEWDRPGARRDAVYNFGTFRFDGLSGVSDFMAGRFRYWLSVSSLEHTVRVYGAAQRSLDAQELALTAAERAELADSLARNALPEHRHYDYDYYRDNCSTRVRDVLDRLLEGQLQRGLQQPGRLTFRQHTLRLVGDTSWLYGGLDLALGAPTDRPITRWDELFLPQELQSALSTTSRELNGQRVALVRSQRHLLDAKPRPSWREPPERRPHFAAVGLALAFTLVVLGWAAGRWRRLRVVFGTLSCGLGLLLGLLGCVFLGFWLFSEHWAAHQNLNLLVCPPWAIALAVLGPALGLGRPRAHQRVSRWLQLTLASSSLALVISLFSTAGPEQQRMVLLFLPLWAGWLLAVRLSLRLS